MDKFAVNAETYDEINREIWRKYGIISSGYSSGDDFSDLGECVQSLINDSSADSASFLSTKFFLCKFPVKGRPWVFLSKRPLKPKIAKALVQFQDASYAMIVDRTLQRTECREILVETAVLRTILGNSYAKFIKAGNRRNDES